MHVVEDEPHGVVADRMDFEDLHLALAADELALVGVVALHFGARTFDAKIFGRKLEPFAIFERNRERLAVLAEAEFGRPMVVGGGILRHSVSLSLEAAT